MIKSGKGFKKNPIDYNVLCLSHDSGCSLPGRSLQVCCEQTAQFFHKYQRRHTSTIPRQVLPDFNHREPELAKALLFTDKSKTTDLFKALSIDFHHRLSLGEIRSKEEKLVEQYGKDCNLASLL